MDLEKIPQELKPDPHFVLWREETRSGKLTKIPVNAHTGENAAVDRPETWATFAGAVAALTRNGKGLRGMGFVLTKSGPYTVIDLDHCRDPESGIIEPWAQEIIDRMASYTEISPSGTGVHIWVIGKLPPGRRRKGNFEAYDSDRYLTLTGDHLEGTPLTIEPCQVELETLHGEIFGKPREPKATSTKSTGRVPDGPCGLSDDDLIDRIRKSKGGAKFDRLMTSSDLEDLQFRYSLPSQSEVDLSLCSILAWWTRKDAEQMDRIFRRSALYRDKWDEYRGGQTYGEWTIAKAIAGTTGGWGGGGKRRKSKPAQARPPEPGGETTGGGGEPEIIITKRFLDDKSNEAIRALETANNPPVLFRRSGTLARISSDEKQNPRIETINDNQLRGILARCAHFLKETEKGMVPTSPPMDLVKDILALGNWNFPPLEGIIQAPAMRPDGTVLNQPGYDPQTGLYYITPPNLLIPPISENPSQEALEEALGYLFEIICDFPFVEDADRANALGLIITPPLRPAIAGNVPMAAISAPTPGTGKGLLTEIVSLLGSGKVAPMAGVPRDDDEMRKFITSRLLEGGPLVAFDNLEFPLWGPSLCRALTCTIWEDRILGQSTTVRLPQRAVWIANGNNLKLRGDLPRRTFPIHLDAKLAKPWERKNFRHKNLKEWILLCRGDFLAAILTLGRAWFVAGKPEPKNPLPVMGGFEEWSKTVGGILSFAGVDSFLENLKRFHDEADLEGPEWEAFLNAWVEVIGESTKTCKEVASILRENPEFASTLPDNLRDVLKDPEKSFERSLGRALARKENRPYGEKNLALQRDKTTRDKVSLWKVTPL